MADGKNIEIRIAATGGDQAAGELAKPKQGIDALIVSEDGLAQKREGFLTAAQAEIAEIERETAALDRDEKEMNKWKDAQAGASKAMAKTGEVLGGLANEKNKVTKAGVQMGTGMQNVGYQVQDLAVQIGSGTSAFTALGQQAPQLLSGFGPMGIALGTLAGVAIPLAGAMFNLGDSTEEAGKKAEEAAEKVKKFGDQRQARFAAAAAAENKQWIASLDDEYDSIKRTNDALQRSIDLLQAKRRGQIEIENAKAAFEMAEIDEDDNLTDAQKIQGRAKIQAGLEAKKFDARRLDTIAVSDKSERDAGVASGQVHDLEKQEIEAFLKIQDLEGQLVKLTRQIENGAEMAKARLPELKKSLDQADVLLVQALEASNWDDSNPMAIKAKQQYQTAAGKFTHAEKDSQGFGTDEEKGTLKSLRGDLNPETGRYDKSGIIVENRKALMAKQAETAAARMKAEEAEAKAKNDRTAAAEKIEQDREATTYKLSEMNLKSSGAAKKSESARVEKDAKGYGQQFWDDMSEDKRQAKGQLGARETALDNTASTNEAKIKNSQIGQSSKALQGLAKDIGNADTTADLNAVKEAVLAKSQELGAAVVEALMAMIAKQEAMVKSIAALKARIDKMP